MNKKANEQSEEKNLKVRKKRRSPQFNSFIHQMENKYGGKEGFKIMYVKALINGEDIIPEKYKQRFIYCLDLNEPDYIVKEKNSYMKLVDELFSDIGYVLINSKNMETLVNKALNTLPSREKNIIIKRFGIKGETETLQELADKMGISKERVRQIEENALTKLKKEEIKEIIAPSINNVMDDKREEEFIKEFFKYNSILQEDIPEQLDESCIESLEGIIKVAKNEQTVRNRNSEQIMKLSKIKRKSIIESEFPQIIKVNKLKFLSKRVKKKYKDLLTIHCEKIINEDETVPKEIISAVYKQVVESPSAKKYKNLIKRINKTIQKHPDPIINKNPRLIDICVDEKACNILMQENIENLADLLGYSVSELKQIENMKEVTIKSLLYLIHKYGFSMEGDYEYKDEFTDKEKLTKEQAKALEVEEVKFTTRTLLSLKRIGVNTLGELTKYSEDELRKVRNVGVKSIEEMKMELSNRGLKLRAKRISKPQKPKNTNGKKRTRRKAKKGYVKKVLMRKEIKKKEEVIEENPLTPVYKKALELFEEYCEVEINEKRQNEIKEELKILFDDLEEYEKIKIRAKIYKHIKNIAEPKVEQSTKETLKANSKKNSITFAKKEDSKER